MGGELNPLTSIMGSADSGYSLGLPSEALSTFADLQTGIDSFRGEPIVPKRYENKPVSEQFDIKVNVKVEKANSYTIIGDLLKIGDEWKLIWTWEGINKDNNFFGTTILNVNDFMLEGFYFTNYSNIYKINENITYTCNCTAGYFKVKKIETC